MISDTVNLALCVEPQVLLSRFETEEIDVFGRLWFPDTEMPQADKTQTYFNDFSSTAENKGLIESCMSSCGLRTTVIH